jgi:amino acid transporter
MGCAITVIGVIVPRLLIIAWWLNDPARWGKVFDGPILPLFGFLFFPWTTIWYTVFQPTGFDIFSLILLVFAVLVDLGTWGVGYFSNKERVTSYYRDR